MACGAWRPRVQIQPQETTMQIPSDGAMLVSFLNMKLRDEYPSLDDLCEDLELDRREIEARLAAAGYEYDEAQNRIR